MSNLFSKALKRLNEFTNYESESPRDTSAFSTRPIDLLYKKYSQVAQTIPTIHIAGTKGKGSTAWYCGSLFRSTGLSVGVYTSPHLVSVCERISVNGIPISEQAFALLVNDVCDRSEEVLKEHNIKPTWFDIITMMALKHFESQQVDVIVLETGLGGRLDSTNICKPKVTVITRLGLDHTSILGNTLSAIAMEKGGIIKEDVPLVTLNQDNEAMKILRKLCEINHADIHVLGEQFFLSAENGGMDLDTGEHYYSSLTKSSLGFHQWENIALAVKAVELMCDQMGQSLTEKDVRFALVNTELPGRAQLWKDYLLDGAHNPLAMKVLVDVLRELECDKLNLVIGMCQDKDCVAALKLLKPWVKEVYCVQLPSKRSLSPEQLKDMAQKLFGKIPVEACSTVRQALKKARKRRGEDLVLVTGSQYLVGEVLKATFDEKTDMAMS